MIRPTEQTYPELQWAYDFFNEKLFDGKLPACLMTLQRKNRTYGYFSGERWAKRSGEGFTDEIAMNPSHFGNRSLEETLSTLVHEMIHLWQHHFGSPSQRSYHNKEWAARMEKVGLCPSDTGGVGGKKVGQHMSHYIMDNGPFAKACAELLGSGFDLTWTDRAREITSGKGFKIGINGGSGASGKPSRSGVRDKYTCPSCGTNAWGKPDTALICGDCMLTMTPPEDD